MSAARAIEPSPPVAVVEPARPNRASNAVRALYDKSSRELEVVLQRGVTPDLARLAGWEFRGLNVPRWARVAGIQKFIKGFFVDPGHADDGAIYGYNCPVAQDGVDAPWTAKPDDASPKRFGFYRVAPVDPTSRDNQYLHAVLLDYGRGRNGALDPTQGLRDYLVQVEASNPDLYLGKAYYAVGPARVATNFFILERHRPGIRELARP